MNRIGGAAAGGIASLTPGGNNSGGPTHLSLRQALRTNPPSETAGVDFSSGGGDPVGHPQGSASTVVAECFQPYPTQGQAW